MRAIVKDFNSPVYVQEVHGGKIELRIGYPARGETRRAKLSPQQARLVAIALLTKAEKSRAQKSD